MKNLRRAAILSATLLTAAALGIPAASADPGNGKGQTTESTNTSSADTMIVQKTLWCC